MANRILSHWIRVEPRSFSTPRGRPRDCCSETILLPISLTITARHVAAGSFLSGSVDIGLGDGARETFLAGDVFLAEDLTGQGHTATPHDWVRAYVNVE